MWLEVHPLHRPVAQAQSIDDWDSNTAEYCPKVADDTVGASVENKLSQE